MAKNSSWRKLTQKRRRQRYQEQCNICKFRWRDAKTNYMTDLGVCLFCHQRMVSYVNRGAAWMLKRMQTLDIWGMRLQRVMGSRKSKRKAG